MRMDNIEIQRIIEDKVQDISKPMSLNLPHRIGNGNSKTSIKVVEQKFLLPIFIIKHDLKKIGNAKLFWF